MPIQTILLLIFVFPSTTFTPTFHFESNVEDADAAAVQTFTTGEQSPAQKKNAAVQSRSKTNRPKQEAPAQTLTGTVEWEYKTLAWDCDVPNCDHFALYDDATQTNYEIDDARAALPFEGKRAKIIGVVDPKNRIIHLLSIEGVK
jgi:hypothetical protein